MQTLFPRVAQAPSSCRCRIHLHSTNALIRRSTTAAPKRRVPIADVFTACYTTILGTAAVLDARRKNRKREALDAELDRARASLRTLAASNAKSFQDVDDDELAELDAPGAPNEPEPNEHVSRIQPLPSHIMNLHRYKSVLPFLEELRGLYNISYRPFPRQTWLQEQIDWVDMEVCVAAEQQNPEAFNQDPFYQDPKTFPQLGRMTRTILNLVDELLRLMATKDGQRPGDIMRIPAQFAREEDIFKELESLNRGYDFPGYQLPNADQAYATRIRAALHDSLRRIFNQALSSKETVGRICYNLLATTIPPNIYTYNILIAGFNRIQRPDLAQVVIDSYLHQTLWAASDQTVICMLSHFREPGGREGLRDAVQRMRGRGKRRLRLSTLEEDSTEDDPSTEQRRVQRTHRTSATFDALIRGWLYHGEIRIACMTFVACLRNGASIPMHTLQGLFQVCLLAANFAIARKLLFGIFQHLEDFSTFLSGLAEDNTVTSFRELLASIHQVMDVSWYPFGEIYGESWRAYALASTTLKTILKRWDLQLEVQDGARLCSRLTNALSSAEPLLNRLELAIADLDAAKSGGQTWTVFDRAYPRLAMLVSIERRYLDLKKRSRDLGLAAKIAIIHAKTGYNMNEGAIPLSECVANRNIMHKRYALGRAVNHIDVWDPFIDVYRIKEQLFRAIPDQDLIRHLAKDYNWKRLGVQTLIFFFRRGVVDRRAPKKNARDQPYWRLEEQIQAAEDSTRALLFAYLNPQKQRAAMWYYSSYYRIPFDKMAEYANREIFLTEVEGLEFRKYDPRLPRRLPPQKAASDEHHQSWPVFGSEDLGLRLAAVECAA
ncbi:hypothetical protein F4861DRAFT_16773 [Xylaria intraflava]|nr:hypothetical protein F4861DRAFT_16773 [Xylaria intraflava]